MTPSISQKDAFLDREGDAWLARNGARLQEMSASGTDPVIDTLAANGIAPRQILEVGCSNGWRLDNLARKHGATGAGVDPSGAAISEGAARYPGLELHRGTADALPFDSGRFDLLIYGFCLYLCDRGDLFRIAAEGDRVLADGGHLVIYDFYTRSPHSRVYHHDPRLVSYKMDNSALFVAHPAYRIVSLVTFGAEAKAATSDDDRVAVFLLQKNSRDAFPLRATP